MVSSPRLIDYETIVIEFAIDLIEAQLKAEGLDSFSIEDEKARLNSETDYRMRFVRQYNIQRMTVV